MSLMNALQFHYAGAPMGPAGAGKTETVKDLAKFLGKPFFVINASDTIDFLMMSKMFKGVVSSSAWICFDEFNRIDL